MRIRDPELRAAEIRAALASKWREKRASVLSQTRGEYTLFLDEEPKLMPNRAGKLVGVDAMVRLFDGNGIELQIDPHRICYYPPVHHKGEFNPEAAYWNWLWDNVISHPNPKGWRTRGTVSTFYADSEEGEVLSLQASDASYSNARNGAGLDVTSGGYGFGQASIANGAFFVLVQLYLSFDTSSIPDTDEIAEVNLGVTDITSGFPGADTGDTFQVRVMADWVADAEEPEWISGGAFAGSTLVASKAVSAWSFLGYNEFTENGASFRSAINVSGRTALVVSTAKFAAGTAPPTNTSAVSIVETHDGSEDSDDWPRLVVTHEAPAGSASPSRLSLLGAG